MRKKKGDQDNKKLNNIMGDQITKENSKIRDLLINC
jgi:hypothetical protein